MIYQIKEEEKKEYICRQVLYALPEWFGMPDSIEEYAAGCRNREGCYEAYDKTNAFYRSLGFRELECFDDLWSKANPCQIYVMAVRRVKHE